MFRPSISRFGSVATTRAGFTLVEMMVVVLLMGLVSVGLYQVLTTSRASYEQQKVTLEVQQNARVAIESIADDFRHVSYGKDPTQPSIEYAAPDSVTFVADIMTDIPGAEKITYSLSLGGDGDTPNPYDTILLKTVADSSGVVLVREAQSYGIKFNGLSFHYYNGNGVELPNPVPHPELIGEVEIQVTAVEPRAHKRLGTYMEETLSTTVYPRNLPLTPARSRPSRPALSTLSVPNCESVTIPWITPTTTKSADIETIADNMAITEDEHKAVLQEVATVAKGLRILGVSGDDFVKQVATVITEELGMTAAAPRSMAGEIAEALKANRDMSTQPQGTQIMVAGFELAAAVREGTEVNIEEAISETGLANATIPGQTTAESRQTLHERFEQFVGAVQEFSEQTSEEAAFTEQVCVEIAKVIDPQYKSPVAQQSSKRVDAMRQAIISQPGEVKQEQKQRLAAYDIAAAVREKAQVQSGESAAAWYEVQLDEAELTHKLQSEYGITDAESIEAFKGFNSLVSGYAVSAANEQEYLEGVDRLIEAVLVGTEQAHESALLDVLAIGLETKPTAAIVEGKAKDEIEKQLARMGMGQARVVRLVDNRQAETGAVGFGTAAEAATGREYIVEIAGSGDDRYVHRVTTKDLETGEVIKVEQATEGKAQALEEVAVGSEVSELSKTSVQVAAKYNRLMSLEIDAKGEITGTGTDKQNYEIGTIVQLYQPAVARSMQEKQPVKEKLSEETMAIIQSLNNVHQEIDALPELHGMIDVIGAYN